MNILLLGVGWARCSALHTAETLVATRRTKKRVFKHSNIWMETPDVADDNGRLFPTVGQAFDKIGAVSRQTVGQAEARLIPYAEFVSFATSMIESLLLRDGRPVSDK